MCVYGETTADLTRPGSPCLWLLSVPPRPAIPIHRYRSYYFYYITEHSLATCIWCQAVFERSLVRRSQSTVVWCCEWEIYMSRWPNELSPPMNYGSCTYANEFVLKRILYENYATVCLHSWLMRPPFVSTGTFTWTPKPTYLIQKIW